MQRQLSVLREAALLDVSERAKELHDLGWDTKVEVTTDEQADAVEIVLKVVVSYPSANGPRMLPFHPERLAEDLGVDLDAPLNEGRFAEAPAP